MPHQLRVTREVLTPIAHHKVCPLPRIYIIICIFTCHVLGKLVPSYVRKMAAKSLHFFLLFGSIDGVGELAREIKYMRKTEGSAIHKILIAIYTYSTVYE